MRSPESIATQRQRVCEAIRRHRSFLVVGHVRPDGDCLGSQIGMALGLLALGKEVRVFSSGPILPHLEFLPKIDLVELSLDPEFTPEVTIFCDCGGGDRVGNGFKPMGYVINIDHHASNDHFGDAAYVDTAATAAGEQVYHILNDLGVVLTPDMANVLFLALMADTGSFKFSNTTSHTFEVATALVRSGADPSEIAAAFYDNLQPGALHLKGLVLSNLHFECDRRLCWSEITQEMYRDAGGEQNEPEGLVSDLRTIEGVEVSILIHELSDGGARAGIRSRGNWNVNLIATELGGGGHHNASGCYIEGDYEEVKARILATARRHLAQPPEVQRAAG